MSRVGSSDIAYPPRVSSLQYLHFELSKERLSLLDEINELKRISMSRAPRHHMTGESSQHAQERSDVYEQSSNNWRDSPGRFPNASPIPEETSQFSEEMDDTSVRMSHFEGSQTDESIYVDVYVPYPIPQNKHSLQTPSRIKPLRIADSPIFKGTLYKLGRNRQWQEREFRTDGYILVCLSKKKVRVKPNTVLLAEYSTPWDPELVQHFYPTNSPLPRMSHPLIATGSSIENSPCHRQYVDFYQPPKWIIPLSDILAVNLLVRNRFKVKKCFVIHTAERKYILRARTEMEINCWLYFLKRMTVDRGGDLSEFGSIVSTSS